MFDQILNRRKMQMWQEKTKYVYNKGKAFTLKMGDVSWTELEYANGLQLVGAVNGYSLTIRFTTNCACSKR